MALKPCGECGEKISTAAKHCPHCGAPSKITAVSNALMGIGCLLTLFVTIPILVFAWLALAS